MSGSAAAKRAAGVVRTSALDVATIEVANQIVQCGWETAQSSPKTTKLRGSGHPRPGHGPRAALFTEPDGSPWHPADVTARFQALAKDTGLSPMRLHDLRHGAATLSLAAGKDTGVVQHMLRHLSITITMDTYTSVLPEVAHAAAEATAKIIPRHATRTLGLLSGSQETTIDSHAAEHETPGKHKTAGQQRC